MKYFDDKKKQKIVQNLLDISNCEGGTKRLTVLQNEISISYNTRVLAVSAVDEDDVGAAFAKALCDVYVSNHSSALLIDANLYNPCIKNMLGLQPTLEDGLRAHTVKENMGVVLLERETYPSVIYKNGTIHNYIKNGLEKYQHVVIIVPTVKEHKEIALLSNIIDSAILVSRRNRTKRTDVYQGLRFLAEENIPVSKVVVLK